MILGRLLVCGCLCMTLQWVTAMPLAALNDNITYPGPQSFLKAFSSYTAFLQWSFIKRMNGIDSANKFYENDQLANANKGFTYFDFLPLNGGTLIGPLQGTSAKFTESLHVGTTTSKATLQVGDRVGIFQPTTDAAFGENVYYNGGWKYIASAPASFMYLQGGTISLFTAPAGTADGTANVVPRFTIANNGTVSIPGQLNVYNAAVGSGQITSEVAGDTGYLKLAGGGSGTGLIDIYGANHSSKPKAITFSTNSLERMRIKSNGDIGIGTANPVGKLDVAGILNVYDSAQGFGVIASGVSGNTGYLELVGGGGGTGKIDIYSANHSVNRKSITFSTNSLERLRIDSNGSVGIGTSAPRSIALGVIPRLDVDGGTGMGAISMHGYSTTNPLAEFSMAVSSNGNFIDATGHATASNNAIIFRTNNTNSNNNVTEAMRIASDGNIGIGTSASLTEKLSVNGNIVAKKIIVKQTAAEWSDYVFANDYKLRTISSLEGFIAQNKHLPGMPSAKEVEANGLSVGDNQALLLKKIEELTLYVIELNKANGVLKKELKAQAQKIDDLNRKIK